MKKTIILLVFSILFIVAYPKIEVTLKLPNNCNTATSSDKTETIRNIVSVYPNPTNGSFTIDIVQKSNIGNAHVSLLSLEGKLITSEKLYTHSNRLIKSIHSQGLAKGTYILKIDTNGASYVKRLIINK